MSCGRSECSKKLRTTWSTYTNDGTGNTDLVHKSIEPHFVVLKFTNTEKEYEEFKTSIINTPDLNPDVAFHIKHGVVYGMRNDGKVPVFVRSISCEKDAEMNFYSGTNTESFKLEKYKDNLCLEFLWCSNCWSTMASNK